MKRILLIILMPVIFQQAIFSQTNNQPKQKIRKMVDTIGFASKKWQMDSVLNRINRMYGRNIQTILQTNNITPETAWKIAISPHDDYSYASYLYPVALNNIRAKVVILFGVAHKAKQFNLENQIVFDNFDAWESAYGTVKISALREEIIKALPKDDYVIHEQLQTVEHSLEPLLPFIKKNNPNVEIVPVLVPAMPLDKTKTISMHLADALTKIINEKNWVWGKDYAMVISTDAVHYGDQGWGESNYAFYGADTTGYMRAVAHEYEIITNCLTRDIVPAKIKTLTEYLLKPGDYKQYQWTWCGRYSIPMGLYTAYNLQMMLGQKGIIGSFLGYSNSIDHQPIPVNDLKMGTTAPANIHHWVGYFSVGYK